MSTVTNCKKHYLFGFMPLGEVNGVLMGDLGHNPNLSELKSHWLSRVAIANQLAQTDPYVINNSNLPEVLVDFEEPQLEVVTKIASRLRESEYWKNVRFEIKLANLDYLIALQSNIDLERANNFASKVPKNPTVENLLELCFDLSRQIPEIDSHMIGQNTFIFSSGDDDVRLGNPQVRIVPMREGEQREGNPLVKSFLLPIIGGDPSVNVVLTCGPVQIGPESSETRFRLTLQNGFHRAYALKSLGISHIPCVVIIPDSVQEAGIYFSNWSPERQQQNNLLRPPLLKDFFNPDLAETLEVRRRRLAWRLHWDSEKLAV